jgi:hypothetical protein
MEIAQVPKMQPRTKHINIKYYHFRDYVKRGEIFIHKVATEDQLSDIWLKPLNAMILNPQGGFMGWYEKSKSWEWVWR